MSAEPMPESRRNHLAWLRGLGEAYYDYRGELRSFSAETRIAILGAMGCDVSDPGAVEREISEFDASYWQALLPSVAVVRGGSNKVVMGIPADRLEERIDWRLRQADGRELVGEVTAGALAEVGRIELNGQMLTRRELMLPDSVPLGFSELRAHLGAGKSGRCALISAPSQCYEPQSLATGERLWGVALQLYTLRSEANWGIGDFADLEAVVRYSAASGASFVGLNPLHAMFQTDPGHCSPYSPSSRHFLNTLYISVPAIPEYAVSDAARDLVSSTAFASELERVRKHPLIDYSAVSELKMPVLRILYEQFRREQLTADTARARQFRSFQDDRGETLRLHALHDAIALHLCEGGLCAPGWQSWPESYQRPDSPEVLAFEARHADDVEFHAWMQWVAEDQLSRAQRVALELDMKIGLYGDYAVSVNASGSETWADQEVYRLGAAVGAPPDALALQGQDWGIPPQDPQSLKRRQYRPFQKLIAANMRNFGALRLDHVMALFRQWWVPVGFGATEGGYVHYPLDDLMSVLALESVSHRCLVVGEDLGTVPDEVRDAMARFAVYHYKVLLFEKEGDGSFRRPENYVARSIATATTHDLPTLLGFWSESDLKLRDELDLFPGEVVRQRVYEERAEDKQHLLSALELQGLRPTTPASAADPFDEALALAVHSYLAGSTARLTALQIEDLIGTAEPVNVPGTSREYPNWRRKLHLTVEETFESQWVQQTLRDVDRARSG